MTGTNVTCARNQRAPRRDVLERVLPDVIASLKENRATVEINAMKTEFWIDLNNAGVEK